MVKTISVIEHAGFVADGMPRPFCAIAKSHFIVTGYSVSQAVLRVMPY